MCGITPIILMIITKWTSSAVSCESIKARLSLCYAPHDEEIKIHALFNTLALEGDCHWTSSRLLAGQVTEPVCTSRRIENLCACYIEPRPSNPQPITLE
jgi:hypothetical protein